MSEGLLENLKSLTQTYSNIEDEYQRLKQTEGDFSATENDYHIMIYHKNQFMQYDELLGTAYINSNRR
jgi:hypothetical protein